MKTRRLTEADISALEIGAGILGAGGGGNTYLAKVRTREIMRSGLPIDLLAPEDLPADAAVVPLAGVGATLVGIERIKEGREGVRALRALEQHLNFTADAIVCTEIGGANSMEPLIIAVQAGLPVVDADGMGRAFPEMQMTTFSIYGHKSTPSAMSDPHGNVVVFEHAVTERWHERMVRATMVAQGGSSTLALAPMSGTFIKEFAIPRSYTKAMALGRAVLGARTHSRDPVEAITALEGGRLAHAGKITDLKREISGGFARGEVRIDGVDDFIGTRARMSLQNEYIALHVDGRLEVVVPDLIVVLDAEDGSPISTEMLRYGQRVAVLVLPSHDLLRTPRALDVVGPDRLA